jgi:hypothetical protein
MVWLRHASCKTPIYEYTGLVPPRRGMSKEWKFADGSHPRPATTDRAHCPDCDSFVFPSPHALRTVDGTAFWPSEMPPPKVETQEKKTLFERFKALFSF